MNTECYLIIYREYCDGSDALACGDRRYCRDARNTAIFKNSGPDTSKQSANKTHNPFNRGLPLEIVAVCLGKSEQAACQVGETFTGGCHTFQNQLECLLDLEEASTDLITQWDKLDRNRDGFLDVNELGDENKPGEHPRRDRKEKSNYWHFIYLMSPKCISRSCPQYC